jgi:hypothetical protein
MLAVPEGVAERAELPPELKATDLLDAGIELLDHSGGSAVPVLHSQAHQVVGWLTHQTALRALRADVAPGQKVMASAVSSA